MLKLFGKYNLILKILLAAILLVIPLYPKFPFLRVPGTHVSVRLEDFLMVTAVVLLLKEYLPRLKTLFERKLERSMLLFLLVGLVSLASAIFVTKTVTPSLGFLHWARRLEYFVPFFLALAVMKAERKDKIDFVIKSVLLAITLVFIYGVGQKYFSLPVIITQNEEYAKGIALNYVSGGHLISTFAGHYDLASYLVLMLPITISSFFLAKGRNSKIILLLVGIAGLWMLSNTLSRIAVASFLIAVTISLLLIKRYKAIPLVLVGSIIVLAFSSSLLDRYLRVFQVVKERLGSVELLDKTVYAKEEETLIPQRMKDTPPTAAPTVVFEDRSASIRLNVEWPRALRAFKKNPILGTGYSSITLATDNDYLRLLGEVGILGASSFLLIITWFLRLITKNFPLTKNFSGIELAFMAGFAGAFIGVLINAMFIDVFEASKFAITFWLFFGTAVSMLRKGKNEENI